MRNRYLALLLTLGCVTPAHANTVSNTNNPVSNSSGSVQNVGVMQMPSRQFQNQYGGGIVCQGSTLAIQPYLVSNMSVTRPYEDSFLDPIYSTLDVEGATDDDGNTIGDGQVDNPGQVIGYKTVRTAQKDNYSITPGISASFNIPLDRKAQRICREAAQRQIDLMQIAWEDKRLVYELNRLKICGSQLKAGVRYKKGTKYEKICADIEIVNKPNTLINHSHELTFEKPSAPSSSQK